MGNFGPLEIIAILVVILLIFGPKRLPGLGKQLGSGMRDFKDAISGDSKDDDDEKGLAGLPPSEKSGATVTPASQTEREREEVKPDGSAG